MRSRWSTCAAVLCLGSVSAGAWAQGGAGRAGTWEIGFGLFDPASESLSGNGGSSLEVDGDIGYGMTGTYNISDHFAVAGTLDWSNPDYIAREPIDGTPTIATIDAELDVSTFQLKGVYYFSASDFSPYIEAGGGWTLVDSNIASGPPTTGCWWDPWWGYICTQYFETYHDTRTSYAAAFGVRWDVTPDILLKLSWGTTTIRTSRYTEDFNQDVFRAEFAWKL